jgi:signal transduction histidine kinase
LYSLVVGVLSAGLRELIGELERRDQEHARLSLAVARLSSANTDFQRYAELVEEKSKQKERRRISREIHDTVGYTLTNIRMMMEAATRLAEKEPQEVKPLLAQARAQAESGLAETRAALRALRSLGETSLSGVRAIQRVTRAFSEATGVEVEVDYGNLPWALDPEVDGVLYRLLQESMTNAFRHGGATRVSVRFSARNGQIAVLVRDNGRGAEEVEEGIGLAGMRERVEQLGGRLSARNVTGGFEVLAWLPREAPHQAD